MQLDANFYDSNSKTYNKVDKQPKKAKNQVHDR